MLLYPWIKHCIILFLFTFIQEDAAIIAASFANVEYGLPIGLAFISVYLGIISGDLFIYGLGHLSQRNRWLRSKIIGPKVEQVKIWLEKNFLWAVAVCRFTPSLLFPTFVAIGWFRMPVKRFLIISVVSSAIYTPIVFIIVRLLGKLVLYRLGYWSWGVLILIIILFPLRKVFLAFRNKGAEKSTSFISFPFLPVFPRNGRNTIKLHWGMPPLKGIKRIISLAERIPNGLIYIPVGIRWLLLSIRYGNLTLPTIANPLIETGGFWGESKSAIMGDVGKEQQRWMARYFVFNRTNQPAETDLRKVLLKMGEQGIDFPVVVKPDIGWQGYGVRNIENERELSDYLSAYSQNEKLLVQQLVSYDG